MICNKKHNHRVKNPTENQGDSGVISIRILDLKLERRKKNGYIIKKKFFLPTIWAKKAYLRCHLDYGVSVQSID